MYAPQPHGYVEHTQGGYPLPNGQPFAGPTYREEQPQGRVPHLLNYMPQCANQHVWLLRLERELSLWNRTMIS